MSATASPAPGAAGAPPAPGRTDAPPYAHGGGWTAIVREFAIIVAGVLCALAAQAWWDAHQERGRERDYLRQLLADTRTNARRLDQAIQTDSTALAYASRAMDALTDTGPAPPPDSLVEWVLQAGVGSEFQPVSGSYRALTGTGDLRLVHNDSLRARLASFAAVLENETERQRQLRQVVAEQAGAAGRAMPFMERVFLRDVRPGRVDVARLRADGEAASVLFGMQAANQNRLSGLRMLRKETAGLLRALQAEPGAAPAGGAADAPKNRLDER